MFGGFRLLLAYLVVLSHLTGSDYLAHFGFYAVRGFFVLSGFVITSALHEVYAFDAGRFWANRSLRLLPLYYIVSLITLAVIISAPSQAKQFAEFWANPNTSDIFHNMFVLTLPFRMVHFRLIMPAWSIPIEIMMYCVLWYACRKQVYAWAFLTFGLTYHIYFLETGAEWWVRYFTPYSASLSFALGALLYFWRRDSGFKISPKWVIPTSLAWVANLFAASWMLPESYTFGACFYLNTLLACAIVAALADWKSSQNMRFADKVLGDLAYPVFLVHWLVGFLVAVAFFPSGAKGWVLTVTATPIIFAAAAALAALNNAWIEPLRTRVRSGETRKVAVSPATVSTVGAD